MMQSSIGSASAAAPRIAKPAGRPQATREEASRARASGAEPPLRGPRPCARSRGADSPAPPAPKAVPGARPTLASSTRRMASARASATPVDPEEGVEGAGRRGQLDPPVAAARPAQTMSRPRRARAI